MKESDSDKFEHRYEKKCKSNNVVQTKDFTYICADCGDAMNKIELTKKSLKDMTLHEMWDYKKGDILIIAILLVIILIVIISNHLQHITDPTNINPYQTSQEYCVKFGC